MDFRFGYAWMLISWPLGVFYGLFSPFPYVFGNPVIALICDGSSYMFGVFDDLSPWGMGIYESVCKIH